MTVVLVTTFSQTESLSDDQKAQITSGLEAGQAIGNYIKEGNFKESLKKIGTSVADYLGVVGPFVDIVLGFIPGPDSAELAYMKEMMKQIDTRFDRLDSRFNDIERLIDWNAVTVSFGALEQNIEAVIEEYEHVYEVPPEAAAIQKNIFVDRYDNDYENSGYKLYRAMVEPSGKFHENLGISVMRYTKNDLKKTQIFLLGVMQLLLQASKLEISYLHAKNFTPNAEFMTREWETRLEEVKTEFERIDYEVAQLWHSQSGMDIDEYSAMNSGMSNKDFAHALKNKLNEKYYWRIWFVIVYNPISGSDNHYVHKHGGHHRYRQHGRNIIVASKHGDEPRMSSSIAQDRLNRLNHYSYNSLYKAKDFFNHIKPASNAGSWGVIRGDKNTWYAWSGGAFKRNIRDYILWQPGTMLDIPLKFELFMWG